MIHPSKQIALIQIIIAILLFTACIEANTPPIKSVPAAVDDKRSKYEVVVQPLGKADAQFVNNTVSRLKQFLPSVTLSKPMALPTSAYYKPRGRYRADSIIHWLKRNAKPGIVYLGITQQDISTTKGKEVDWGVMGLGFRPGNACVASSNRLKNKNNFIKVAIHELGHTAGLPHCPEPTCLMRDAEGGDPTEEEKEFCKSCSSVLSKLGWRV